MLHLKLHKIHRLLNTTLADPGYQFTSHVLHHPLHDHWKLGCLELQSNLLTDNSDGAGLQLSVRALGFRVQPLGFGCI